MSVLTFKILPEDFQEALDRLGSIGEVRTLNVSADDVTEGIVDPWSRIATAEAIVERLRDLIESATDIEAITELESRLLDRETQLETMRGRLRTLETRVDLATIVLTLTEALANPVIVLEPSAYPGHEDAGLSCPSSEFVEVDQDDDVTICFEIRNTGDTPLTDLAVIDTVLDVELDDLIAVFGDPAEVLEPGQSIDLAMETTAERDLRTRTRVEAIPVYQRSAGRRSRDRQHLIRVRVGG